ncbi:MAG: family 10 glycosylhydrolase [Bacteroidaceae bacterium]|nr:family 10 glycosylhydrolase [Bacteroidaceae bacterium]
MPSKLKRFILILPLLAMFLETPCVNPKREFRGAWIQAVNHQFEGIPAAKLKKTLSDQLDSLAACGINAILFQVRVEGDALYKSDLEPWSAYLTGRQGQAPDEDWDPLRFMVAQCHDRGMELHAWINPFRAKTASTKRLDPKHQATIHPERFVKYGTLTLFNPALQENRDFICSVAADIVRRYDIDGFHIDDYFYPYPESGLVFNDDADFRRDPRGFTTKADWRRDNVNIFIAQLYSTIKELKPWVKFGISPFGIYRNASAEYPEGSDTNGLENFSGLYADVLHWLDMGWMDYCIPQVYWNVGTKVADYNVLVEWWADNARGCPMYIGQDVERTVKGKDPRNSSAHQEVLKMDLQRSRPELMGSCQWPAKSVVDNPGNYRTILKKQYYNTPALQPLSPGISQQEPGKVRKVRKLLTSDGPVLFWTPPSSKSGDADACKYVVYCFDAGDKIDIDDPSHIVAITEHTFYLLPDVGRDVQQFYVITALSRVQAESKPVRIKVRN